MQKNNSQNKRYGIAILLNALIMPGAGHLFLKQRIKGTILSILTLVMFIIPIAVYISDAMSGIDMLMAKNATQLSANIMGAMTSSWSMHRHMISSFAFAIIVLWVYAIIDVILMMMRGKNEDSQDG